MKRLGWVLTLAGWIAGWVMLARWPRLAARRSTATLPDVVVPARDEEASLPLLLDDLARQARPVRRVVVVDDGSTDSTGELARTHPLAHEGTLVVLDAGVSPAGWIGKSWALSVALSHLANDEGAAGAVVALDADVRLSPAALDSLAQELEERGGLVSVAPHHDAREGFEPASAIFNLVGVMASGPGWPTRSGRSNGANGACLAFSRAAYDRSGGHSRSPGDVAEDLALAEAFRSAGEPTWMLAGGEQVSYRMYRDLGSIVEGWSKNIATGASRTPALACVAVSLWIGGMLSAPLHLAMGQRKLAALTYLAYAGQLAVQLPRVGSFGRAAPALHPVLAGAFVAIFARSLHLRSFRGRTTWKGRQVVLSRGAGR